jgi:hypothetical protein
MFNKILSKILKDSQNKTKLLQFLSIEITSTPVYGKEVYSTVGDSVLCAHWLIWILSILHPASMKRLT